MSTAPKLQTIDQVATTAIAVEDPLVLLLENGPAFSALITSHVSAASPRGKILLEDCLQFRISPTSHCKTRKFKSVEVTKDDQSRHWIASPDGFQSVFSQPSLDPYAFILLEELTSKAIKKTLEKEVYEDAFMMIRTRLASLLRFFSPSGSELHSPENYAAGSKLLEKRFRIIP